MLRFVSIVALVIFLISALVAGGFFWELNYGSCKDGCPGGMAFIFYLPALIIAGVSGVIAVATRLMGNRESS